MFNGERSKLTAYFVENIAPLDILFTISNQLSETLYSDICFYV